jgi:hypothetical protein
MVNTKSTSTGSGQQGQNNQGTDQPLPMPPPLTPEQFFQLQMQMMATLNNTVQTLQQIHTQPTPPPPQQPRDRRLDFLRGHRQRSPMRLIHSRLTTGFVRWSTSWMSLSAMTGSESYTRQGSCEAQLSIGGSPTQLGTATPSLRSISGSVSGTTTSLLE